MNFYENVVIDYLRADRALFINSQCCIQINDALNPDASGPHWYSDAIGVDFRNNSIFLCEISYGAQLADLTKRLRAWNENWDGVKAALARDCKVPVSWPVRPWLFIPEGAIPVLLKRLDQIDKQSGLRFAPKVTPLEMVQPWKYRSWNRIGEAEKPGLLPLHLQ